MQTIDNETSNRITSLRFLLIIFVILIHSNIKEMKFSNYTITYNIPFYVTLIKTLLSEIIASPAIPIFFLFSGYLLYIKDYSYRDQMKKKSKTLLLPYLYWTILNILFYFIAQSFEFSKPYFTNQNTIIRNFEFWDWIDIFFGAFTKRAPFPLVYQFWFLRDLIVLTFLYIPIKKIINRFPAAFLALIIILWLININLYIIQPDSLLFFSLGYYLIKYDFSFKTLDKINYYTLIPFVTIGIILQIVYNNLIFIKYINILSIMLLYLKLTEYLISNKKVYHLLSLLSGYTFFVYAAHEPLLAILKKITVKIIPMQGSYILLQYFTIVFMGVTIPLMLGIYIRKFTPRIYNRITGMR